MMSLAVPPHASLAEVSALSESIMPDYVDPSMVLYAAFFWLFIMRAVFGWKCCGVKFIYTNYCTIMYLVLGCLGIYAICRFIAVSFAEHYRPTDVFLHPDADISAIPWLRWFIWGCPFALVISYVLCIAQTGRHIDEIMKDHAELSHDRAIQVIGIPAVYGTMMLSSIVPVYHLIASGDHTRWEAERETASQRYDSCFFVADVYEAWALYQFGMLTLEQVNLNIHKKTGRSRRSSFQEHSRELFTSHSAVAQLMWLGVFLFIVVCLSQAGYALALNVVGGGGYLSDAMVEQFEIAGLLASSAAIYNVYIVESTFHHLLVSYRPRLKFISVKILVSLAFFQRGAIVLCQTVNSWQPSAMQGVTRRLPFIGDILNMSSVEMQLFYPALIIYECLISSMLHSWAWAPDETWYDDMAVAEDETEKLSGSSSDESERRPLLPPSPSPEDHRLPPPAAPAANAEPPEAVCKPGEDAV